MKKIATALTLVSGLALMGSAFAQVPGASNVYFLDSSVPGAVSVWVDGHKVFGSQFVNSPSMFSRPVSPGQHEVVLTPFYARPGQADIARATMNFRPGTYTLRVGNFASNSALYGNNYKAQTLYMTRGAPN